MINANTMLIIDSCLIFIISIYFILSKIKGLWSKSKKDELPMIPITPETKQSDMQLVYESMDKAIIKSLYFFVMKDFKFSDKCSVKQYNSEKYRDLINYLIRPDIFITETIDNESRDISFFDYFFNKVYLFYISETSSNIKNLLFKYFSGKTIENYNNPKAKPSALPFLVEYTKNFLYKKFYEIQSVESYCLDTVNNNKLNASDYEKMMIKYDHECVRKICLNIYNMDDIKEIKNVLSPEHQNNNSENNDNTHKEKKNEFSINFNEQSK